MMPSLPFDRVETNTQRDTAMQKVGQAAEDRRPGFSEDACAYVLSYLRQHGPTSGERLTLACKAADIVPHSDKAFGPVYMSLSRRGLIVKVGTVRRERGHGTAGGNVWGLAE